MRRRDQTILPRFEMQNLGQHGRSSTETGYRQSTVAEEKKKKVPGNLQLIPLSIQLTPIPPYQDQDEMRDRSLFPPSYNPDDLLAFPFPYVPPLTQELIDERFRASRAQSQGDVYQRLFRDMLHPNPMEEGNSPCGSCPCCQKMLSYVSTLRTVLDHMVSDIVLKSPAGTRVAPCVLCLQEHKEHGSHEGDPDIGQEDKTKSQSSRPDVITATPSEDGLNQKTSQGPGSTPRSSQGPGSTPRTSQGPGSTPRTSQGPASTPRTSQGPGSTSRTAQRKNSTPKTSSDSSRGGRGRARSQGGQSRSQEELPEKLFSQESKISEDKELSKGQDEQHRNRQDLGEQNDLQNDSSRSKVLQTQVNNEKEKIRQTQSSQSSKIIQTTDAIPEKAHSSSSPSTSSQSLPQSPLRPTSFVQPLINSNGESIEDQSQRREDDTMWVETRAELLKPPELSPRDNRSPTGLYGGQHIHNPTDEGLSGIEAYVTMATDNLSALCCLTLGNSLLLSETTRMLAVIVTDGVTTVLRHQLQNVFDVVQGVGVMDSQGSTKLALLEQPELGVSFTKLYIWALDQFSKCVFLDSNTLVVQNCDELFDRQELSAVPDIGWPDCFNSGVFVFTPSQDTFWKLIHFAEQQSSFDGGDQGLLNIFFQNWAADISRKLPFLYNLMANVSYTYKPAFKQFGKRVKIVHFFGSYKPWNVQFHPKTGQMAPGSNVHPTYAQFVHYWLEIYTKRVLPFFSQEIQDHMYSQEYACPHEVLQFVPSPARQQESLPTQPSFRVYSGDKPRDQPSVVDSVLQLVPDKGDTTQFETVVKTNEEASSNEDCAKPDEELQTIVVPDVVDPNTLPGAEMDDYQNMAAWEQGRMDYMGNAGSDNIMKRLDFLMRDKKESKEFI